MAERNIKIVETKTGRVPVPWVKFCAKCRWRSSNPEDLIAKRVEYRKLGANGRAIRSRVTGYLCMRCLDEEPEYNLPRLRPFADASVERYEMPDIERPLSELERAERDRLRARDADRYAGLNAIAQKIIQ